MLKGISLKLLKRSAFTILLQNKDDFLRVNRDSDLKKNLQKINKQK